jgi:hypothetical protein
MMVYQEPQSLVRDSVLDFCLAVGLRVIHGGELDLDTRHVAETRPKPVDELRTSVRDYG